VPARTAIGLDIGSTAVRAAELSFGKDGVTLQAVGQVLLPEGAVRDGEVLDAPAVTAALRQLWSSTRFRSKHVVLGVANQRVVVRQTDLPAMPESDLAAALPFQVQDLLPMPVEDAVLDFHRLEDVTGPAGQPLMRGLLVAASKEMVLTNVACVQAAGLTVDSVDLTPFAVLRSLGARLDVDVETEALVDVGARVTNIVVHSGGVPQFVRILLLGGQEVTDTVAELLGLTPEEAEALKLAHRVDAAAEAEAEAEADADPEADAPVGVGPVPTAAVVTDASQALVDEIRGSLDYYDTGHPHSPVQRLVLSGGGSLLDGLAARLADATRVPVHRGDSLTGLRVGRRPLDPDEVAALAPRVAVPVGLAMGGTR